MSERGFDNGTPTWETFLQAPVSSECTVRVLTTGKLDDAGLERLIEYINLVKDGFRPEPIQSPEPCGEAATFQKEDL